MTGDVDPVLVEVTRGPRVESRHRGAIAIVDAFGKTRLAIGDISQRVFPRSAVKPLQALALVESGAADRFGLGPRALALACSSHNGEPLHVEVARQMLAAAGRSEQDLECGVQVPSSHEAADALVRAGIAPGAIHNNCSGKHSGFICVAAFRGFDVKGYVGPEHSVQREVRSILSEMTSTSLDETVRGVDGCSIPTYAIPLERIALGFARFVSGEGMTARRSLAARRLMDAVWAEPFLVAGSGRICTDAMTRFPGRVILKTGAEGVFCAGFPESGLGVAVKCDDGAGRAADTIISNVISVLLKLSVEEKVGFAKRINPPIMSRRGARVGEIRLAAGIAESLAGAMA